MISSAETVNAAKTAGRAMAQDRALDAGSERQVVKPAISARQGVTGHNVRYVLAFGLVGVIVAFAVLYFSYLK